MATTYYVDHQYGSGGDGSEGSPYDNVNDITLVDGDTVLFKRGSVHDVTWAWIITVPNITVDAYGDESMPRPVWDNTGGTGSRSLHIQAGNFSISNMHIKSCSANTGNTKGIEVYSNVVGLTVRNCKFEGQANTANGVFYAIDSGASFPLQITDNEVVGAGVGFWFRNTSAVAGERLLSSTTPSYISRNILHNWSFADSHDGTGDGIGFSNVNNEESDMNYLLTVSDNVINGWSENGIDLKCVSKVICERNILDSVASVARTGSTGASGITLGAGSGTGYVGGHSQIIRNNVLRNIQGVSGDTTNEFTAISSRGASDCDIYNNILIDIQHSFSVFVANENDGNRFYNNTIIRDIGGTDGTNDFYVIRADGANNVLKIYNNVFIDCASTDTFVSGDSGELEYGYNCFDQTYDFVSGTGTLTNSGSNVVADPLLDDNYYPTQNSPCIGAGTVLISDKDAYGRYNMTDGNHIGAVWPEEEMTITRRQF